MSETKFMPGPWKSQSNWHCPGALKGALVHAVDDEIGVSPRIADVSAASVGSQEKCMANAHLIAAAPDLYEVLNCLACAIIGEVNGIPNDLKEQLVRADAALAKARGETV
jgi:hypothetical protein